jgi:undecaprenyl-diphosphatase
VSIGQAVILGVVQGITEFFPISSSGHLVILQNLFGIKKPMMAFDVFLHFGTIISVLIFFWKDIFIMLREKSSMLKFIIIGSIPTFIMAILFKKVVEGLFASTLIVGYSLVITGVFLLIASFFALYNKNKLHNKDLTVGKSIIVGIAQGISTVPGISRSGTTIGTSLIAGLNEEMAIKFSFLLSVPAVLGANLLKMKEIYGNLIEIDSLPFFAGAIAAMITGIIAIRVLYSMFRKNLFFLFGVYCLLAGVAVIVLVH